MAAPAGATSNTQLKAKTLSLSNMPAGWSVDNSASAAPTTGLTGCLKNLEAIGNPPKGIARASVSYQVQTFPSFAETLEGGNGAVSRYEKYRKVLENCKQLSLSVSGGVQVTGSVGAMSFPTVGNSSSAFALTLSARGITVGIDIVLFRYGAVDGLILYGSMTPNTAATFQAFATAAVDKVEGKSVPSIGAV